MCDKIQKEVFEGMVQKTRTALHNKPPRRHSNNVLKSKLLIICSMFLRLIDASPVVSRNVLAQQAQRKGNELQVISIASVLEFADG